MQMIWFCLIRIKFANLIHILYFLDKKSFQGTICSLNKLWNCLKKISQLFRFKRNLNRHSPIRIIEAPVRAYIPASLPPGSIHTGYGHNPGGGLLHGTPSLYDWQESTIPMDVASYRSLPNNWSFSFKIVKIAFRVSHS